MSSIPPAAMTSASETLATVTPIAPARRRRCAIAGHLNALACGRHATPRVPEVARHPVDVLLERLQVDQEGRRIQLAHRQADRAELHGGLWLASRCEFSRETPSSDVRRHFEAAAVFA